MPEKCAKVSAPCRTKKLLVPTRSDLFAKAARSFPPLVRVEHEFGTRLALPSPVFPHHPFLIHELDATDIAEHVYRPPDCKRHWPESKVMNTILALLLSYAG